MFKSFLYIACLQLVCGYRINRPLEETISMEKDAFRGTGNDLLGLLKGITSTDRDEEAWDNLVGNLRISRQLPASLPQGGGGFFFDDDEIFSNSNRNTFPQRRQRPNTPSNPRPTTARPTLTGSTVAIPGNQPHIPDCVFFCPTTPEYNPVCGTDDVTYTNMSKLRCAQRCGINVEVKRRLACPR